MNLTMTTTKKKTALATARSLDSFLMFKDKEFIKDIKFVTMQPLNKSKVRGWFIEEEDFEACKWTATESDFEKNTVLFGYKQTFGMGMKAKVKTGVNFTKPRIQIILRSPLMIEEKNWPNTTIGTWNDPEAKALLDNDKAAAEVSKIKKESYETKYQARTKYLIYVLKKDNTPAHQIPIVLTIKGLNGIDFSEKVKLFQDEMGKCLSKALGQEAPLKYNEKFFATTVFIPDLITDLRGLNQNEICAIESFDTPDYSTQDAAIESLDRLTIPDDARELTWNQQEDQWYKGYINQHYAQDAAKPEIKGAYGLKPGLSILPEGTDDKALAATPVNVDTGEDAAL